MPRNPAAPDSQLAQFIAQLERDLQRRGVSGDVTGAGRYDALRIEPRGRETYSDAQRAFLDAAKRKEAAMREAARPRATPIPAGRLEELRRLYPTPGEGRDKMLRAGAREYDRIKGLTPEERRTEFNEHAKTLAEGASFIGGIPTAFALPLRIGTGLKGALSGAGLSLLGDAMMEPAMERMLGVDVTDPAASATFGAVAGAKGKIAPALIAAMGVSSGDAEAGRIHPLRQMLYRGHNGAPNEERIFATPQRKVAEYYAQKRANQLGGTPTLEHLLVDPFAGRSYGHSIPIDDLNREVRMTQARELRPEDVLQRYAGGGLARIARRLSADAAPPRKGVADVVKNKGGNWLTGSVEDALSGLKTPISPTFREDVARTGNQVDEVALAREEMFNNWIDKQLTRYVKNEMATPEDPIRALADRGVLHFEPRGIYDRAPIMNDVVIARQSAGFPSQEQAITPLGEQWERYADAAVRTKKAGEYKTGASLAKTYPEDADWLAKVPYDTPVHQVDNWMLGGLGNGEQLGFSHLTDELRNALDPNSGLPRELLLNPNSMSRLSVPQAVERVAAINKWRAEQKVAADLARANNAATKLHKEYPEKGFRWVELTKPDNVELSDDQLRAAMKERGMYDDEIEGALRDPAIRAEISEQAVADVGPLRDALKYEGDTMGHCVGGYCNDVLEGRSRIFSLRDAKGQPHVTIEVTPSVLDHNELSEEQYQQALQYVKENFEGRNSPENIGKAARTLFPEFDQQRIVQIKGKQNRAPNAEYLPFVQDFVRSQKWSDVGDLGNTGLRRSRDVWNDLEVAKIKEAGLTFDDLITAEEINAINDKVWPGNSTYFPLKKAEGGLVESDDDLSPILEIASKNWKKFAVGGVVQADPNGVTDEILTGLLDIAAQKYGQLAPNQQNPAIMPTMN